MAAEIVVKLNVAKSFTCAVKRFGKAMEAFGCALLKFTTSFSTPAPRGVPTGLLPIRVYQVSETEWYAGADAESCVEKLRADVAAGCSGVGKEEVESDIEEFGEPEVVPDDKMLVMKFHDDDSGKTISFREHLDNVIASGAEFPQFFASSEY